MGSFFVTPLALLLLDNSVLQNGPWSLGDYLEFYQTLFSPGPDGVYAWLLLLMPVIIYEFAGGCRYYYHHPEQIRSIFEFPRRPKN